MLRNLTAISAQIGGIVLVALSAFITSMLDFEPITALRIAIGYFALWLLSAVGIQSIANILIVESLVWAFLSTTFFAIPAAVLYVATRRFFRERLSPLLIFLWLMTFLWMFYVGPDWVGP